MPRLRRAWGSPTGDSAPHRVPGDGCPSQQHPRQGSAAARTAVARLHPAGMTPCEPRGGPKAPTRDGPGRDYGQVQLPLCRGRWEVSHAPPVSLRDPGLGVRADAGLAGAGSRGTWGCGMQTVGRRARPAFWAAAPWLPATLSGWTLGVWATGVWALGLRRLPAQGQSPRGSGEGSCSVPGVRVGRVCSKLLGCGRAMRDLSGPWRAASAEGGAEGRASAGGVRRSATRAHLAPSSLTSRFF